MTYCSRFEIILDKAKYFNELKSHIENQTLIFLKKHCQQGTLVNTNCFCWHNYIYIQVFIGGIISKYLHHELEDEWQNDILLMIEIYGDKNVSESDNEGIDL